MSGPNKTIDHWLENAPTKTLENVLQRIQEELEKRQRESIQAMANQAEDGDWIQFLEPGHRKTSGGQASRE